MKSTKYCLKQANSVVLNFQLFSVYVLKSMLLEDPVIFIVIVIIMLQTYETMYARVRTSLALQ